MLNKKLYTNVILKCNKWIFIMNGTIMKVYKSKKTNILGIKNCGNMNQITLIGFHSEEEVLLTRGFLIIKHRFFVMNYWIII